MVNILDKKGKPVRPVTAAARRQTYIRNMIHNETKDFVLGKADSVPALWEIKNKLKSLPNNPYGMELTKGHTNPQVHHDCMKIRADEFIEAKAFGRFVVYYDPAAVQEAVRETRDKDKLAGINERYKFLQELPRKKTYY